MRLRSGNVLSSQPPPPPAQVPNDDRVGALLGRTVVLGGKAFGYCFLATRLWAYAYRENSLVAFAGHIAAAGVGLVYATSTAIALGRLSCAMRKEAGEGGESFVLEHHLFA